MRVLSLSSFLVGVFPTTAMSVGQTVASDNTPLDLGSATVCASSQTPPAGCRAIGTIHFRVIAGGTLGAPKVLTLGAPNQDFTLAGNTCSGNVATATSCVVKVAFAPKFPGERTGAVEITDESGNVLARRLVHGIGLGPEINLDNGILTTLANSPLPNMVHSGLAVDAAGNVFYGNDSPAVVYKIPAGGGPPVTVAAISASPVGVALDGAGNLYVSGEQANQVVEVPPGCVDTTCQIVLDGGFYQPTGIAVDFSGNVYIADTSNHRIVKMPPGCVTRSCVVTIGQGWSDPFAIALDGAGNLFVSDINGGVVKANITSGQKTTVATPDLLVYGMAVDAAGDLYMTDAFGRQILELPAAGGPLVTVAGTVSEPWSLTVDGGGNVFITNVLTNTAVAEVHRVQPLTYTYATTPVDTTSTDSPQAFRVQNTGNAALSLLGLSMDPRDNFVQVAGPGTAPDCKTGLSLLPGASCDLSLSYTPISAGPATFTGVILNNMGNMTSAQTIPLAGIGGATGPSVYFPAGFSYLYGDTSVSLGLTFNGHAVIGNNVLQLTDGGLNESGSSFSSTPIGLSFFQTSFDFQLTGKDKPAPDADGIAFVLEENGPNALGSSGGGLGYGLPALGQPGTKIIDSVAVKFDLHNNDGEGTSSTGFYLNGAAPTAPSINLLPSGIDLHNGHGFHVVLVYDGSALHLSINDQITRATFSTSFFPVNLAGLLGSATAFAGFTGSTGSEAAVQSILNWQLTSSACCTAGMPTFPAGFSSASGDLTLNGAALISPSLSGAVLQLERSATFAASSAYYSTAIPVNKFTSDFDFQLSRGDGEGFTFVLQASGLNALGATGSGLGYATIPKSVAVKFDRFSDAGEGANSTGVYAGGASPTVPSTNVLPAGVNLHGGDPFHARLTYDGVNLTVSVTDLLHYAVFTGTYPIDIPAAIGAPAAYAGFTAATGASAETVQIFNWEMTYF